MLTTWDTTQEKIFESRKHNDLEVKSTFDQSIVDNDLECFSFSVWTQLLPNPKQENSQQSYNIGN